MRIVIIGTGYVGLVTGTCFAESGNDVTCVDVDQAEGRHAPPGRDADLRAGPGRAGPRNTAAGRLHFTTDLPGAVSAAECVFIAVGTPQGASGAADLSSVWAVVEALAPHLRPDAVVVIKSTVPVGTNRRIQRLLSERTGRDVDVASNPEFLKEGCAIDDFTKPDRVVVGVLRPEVAEVLHELYRPFLRTENPFLAMGPESAR